MIGAGTDDVLVDELTVRAVTVNQECLLTVWMNRRPEDDNASLVAALVGDNYEEVQAALKVSRDGRISIRPQNLAKDYWFWRVDGNAASGHKVQIGPIENDRFMPKASFQWTEQPGRLEGPKGGPTEKFMSVPREPTQVECDSFSTLRKLAFPTTASISTNRPTE